jgi:hypothetical protein
VVQVLDRAQARAALPRQAVMTIIFEYRRTMASAKFKTGHGEERPTPKRSALAALSLRWQEKARARELEEARARSRTIAETELRLNVAKERSALGITILPTTLPAAIVEQVAFWHDVPVRDIMSASRTDRVVEARYDAIVAIAINCRIAGRAMSLTDIAHCLGRHHTSILVALQKRGLRQPVSPPGADAASWRS